MSLFVGTLGNECSVCGKYFRHRVEVNGDKEMKKIITKHNECMTVTKRIMELKEQLKILQQELVDCEFTLFCIQLSKHNVDD